MENTEKQRKNFTVGNGHPEKGFHITSYKRMRNEDMVFTGYSDEKPNPGDTILTIQGNLYEVVRVDSYEPHGKMKTNIFKLRAKLISGMPF